MVVLLNILLTYLVLGMPIGILLIRDYDSFYESILTYILWPYALVKAMIRLNKRKFYYFLWALNSGSNIVVLVYLLSKQMFIYATILFLTGLIVDIGFYQYFTGNKKQFKG
jgi:hypothetical protein